MFDASIEPILSENIIKFFLDWLKDDVLLKKNFSQRRKFFLSSSAILSMLASGSALVLGAKFGEGLQSENSQAQKILGAYFGGFSFIPVAASSMISAVSVCDDITHVRSESEKALLAHHHNNNYVKFARAIYLFYIIIVACIASVSDVYNTAIQFYPIMDLGALLFIIPDVLIAPLFNAYYFNQLNKIVYSDLRGLFSNTKRNNEENLSDDYRKKSLEF